MKKTNDEFILKKILEYCWDIQNAINENNITKEHFFENKMYMHACSMCILQIGELTKRLSDELKDGEPQVFWKGWAGIRDIFAHRYHEADIEILWSTVTDDLPILQKTCERLLQ